MQNLYQSLVAVEPTTLLVTILNLFLQLYLIKRFFLNKILKILEQRRKRTEQQLADAQSAKEEALSMKEAYENNVRQAKAEAGQILADAKRTAAVRSEQILQEARLQATQLKQKAQGDISRQQQRAMNDAKNEIAEIAVAIAGKVIGHSLKAVDQAQLVDSFIDELWEGV